MQDKFHQVQPLLNRDITEKPRHLLNVREYKCVILDVLDIIDKYPFDVQDGEPLLSYLDRLSHRLLDKLLP